MKKIAQYELKKKLRTGGMGEVWLAEHLVLGRNVAVKLIPESLAADTGRQTRFLREARLAAKLDHPNIVRVHDAGNENGSLFVVMEYVDGESLDETVRSLGRFEWREATRVIRDAALGLAAAHNHNFVHRDIKPSNLMRTIDGVTKVVDFGLARDVFSITDLTHVGTLLGTPQFMSPEQWNCAEPDARSDLYSLICTYYFLLTGRLPFDGRTLPALCNLHLNAPFPDPAKLISDLPPEISRCVGRGSQKALADRYQSAKELITDLELLLGDTRAKATGGHAKPAAIRSSPNTLIAPVSSSTQTEIQPLEIVTNSIGLKLTLIPAGEFLMGTPTGEVGASNEERPQHRVKISQPFYLGVYAVTQQEYAAVMDRNPSWFSRLGGGKDKVAGQDTSRFPRENVSWADAVKFCRKLSVREGKTYRLPTEAEWEYACRANTTTKYSFDGDESLLVEHAWFDKNSSGQTQPVGTKLSNAWGLHDMHGNVWEWCQDWFGEYSSAPAIDPTGPESETGRILRGGSWLSNQRACRSAFRIVNQPGLCSNVIGFRVART